MVKGVIFDMDGTMFDTERLSTKGCIYAGKKHILETDWITIQRVQ